MIWKNTVKPLLIPVGTPLATIGTGIILLLVLQTPWMTGVSFVLGLVGIVITLLKSTHETLAKSRPVHAEAIIWNLDRTDVIGVQLFNPDTSAVAISSVTLVVKTNRNEEREFFSDELEADKREQGFLEPSGFYSSSFELGAKKVVVFRQCRLAQFGWDELLKLPPRTFWIEIDCYGGAKMQVNGKKIQEAIKKKYPNVSQLVEKMS